MVKLKSIDFNDLSEVIYLVIIAAAGLKLSF